MTIGTPLASLMDGRDAMVAIGMNGEPLPAEHGFPVRMVVPGLYGYRLRHEVGRRPRADDVRGRQGLLDQARLGDRGPDQDDDPHRHAAAAGKVKAGRVAIGGVAWAQHRGVDKVEVRVDGGDWQRPRSARSVPSVDTGGSGTTSGTPRRANTRSPYARPTGTATTSSPSRGTKPFPSGATGCRRSVVTVA